MVWEEEKKDEKNKTIIEIKVMSEWQMEDSKKWDKNINRCK